MPAVKEKTLSTPNGKIAARIWNSGAPIKVLALHGAKCAVEKTLPAAIAKAEKQISEVIAANNSRFTLGKVEAAKAAVKNKVPFEYGINNPLLTIAITTFNREKFIALNVEWVLKLIERYNGLVRLLVVDNCSTDRSLEGIAAFSSHPLFSLQVNPANVGMLGNIRETAKAASGEYLWIIGDDDFIEEKGLQVIVDALSANRGLPFVFGNFSVYHREVLGASDRPEIFIGEKAPTATKVVPSGCYKLKEIIEQNDNLFTAIYINIFRRDVALECFNYQFDGVLFSDLVHCVPTTNTIIGRYSETDVYWISDSIIVGNCHNSWMGHRVRWHAIIHPMIFDLMGEIGISARFIKTCSRVHRILLQDALERAREFQYKVHLDPTTDKELFERWYGKTFERLTSCLTKADFTPKEFLGEESVDWIQMVKNRLEAE